MIYYSALEIALPCRANTQFAAAVSSIPAERILRSFSSVMLLALPHKAHAETSYVAYEMQPRSRLWLSCRLAVQDGSTGLHIAAMNGRADIAAMLLDRGADVNAVTKVRMLVGHEGLFLLVLHALSPRPMWCKYSHETQYLSCNCANSGDTFWLAAGRRDIAAHRRSDWPHGPRRPAPRTRCKRQFDYEGIFYIIIFWPSYSYHVRMYRLMQNMHFCHIFRVFARVLRFCLQDGHTPLHDAACNDHKHVAALLLRSGGGAIFATKVFSPLMPRALHPACIFSIFARYS